MVENSIMINNRNKFIDLINSREPYQSFYMEGTGIKFINSGDGDVYIVKEGDCTCEKDYIGVIPSDLAKSLNFEKVFYS